MYHEFTLLAIEPIMKEKKIEITTNRDIDVNNQKDIVIELFERATRTPVVFDTVIKDMQLIIYLKDWPIPNTEYILSVKGLKSITDEELESNIKKKIVFKSHILDTARINSPSMYEKVKECIVNVSIISHIEDTECTHCEDEIDPGFQLKEVGTYLEVATDNAFINTIVSTFTSKSEIIISLPKKGVQYYARARVQDYADVKEYGLWTETVTFVYGDKNESGELPDIDTPEPPIFPEDPTEPEVDLEEFQLLTEIEQGITPGKILLLEFSKSLAGIDKSSIIITRKVVR